MLFLSVPGQSTKQNNSDKIKATITMRLNRFGGHDIFVLIN